MLLSYATVYSGLLCSLARAGPFLQTLAAQKHTIGNDFWNVTIGPKYATELYYQNKDLVGKAVGHYVSYNGAAVNLEWTSVAIFKQTEEFLDVSFSAVEGDLHWVIYPDLAGAYQYFVNRALPSVNEFRTLWRLDNTSFPNGHTNIKDGPLPTLDQIATSTNVQDETWQQADGTYITKYDWNAVIRDQDCYGVYGPDFGSWYIVPGKDDYNGNHLKQELMVHRESSTGDAVQLNMLHGTHFQAATFQTFEVGKVFGPWLWYLNDGIIQDAANRAQSEKEQYPYSWFDDDAYQSRGIVRGQIKLSDGRLASGAAVFLGDNHSNLTSLDMGTDYYYTTYAAEDGSFEFPDVRASQYGLQAWSNGGSIGNVSTTFVLNDVTVVGAETAELGSLTWPTQGRELIFQVGTLDRTSIGYKYGNAPRTHGLIADCPANYTHTIGVSSTSDWCYGQSALGTWTIEFSIETLPVNTSAILSVALAGYSQGVSSNIIVNGNHTVGNLTSASITNDPAVYRSGTLAGEWRLFEWPIDHGVLSKGINIVSFQVTRFTLWRGFMWDSVLLEWA